jgi:hypothetical protein
MLICGPCPSVWASRIPGPPVLGKCLLTGHSQEAGRNVRNDPFPYFEYLGQRQLGQYFGATSHEIGRWLDDCGLRGSDRLPTAQALEDGLAKLVIPEVGVGFYTWHKERTLKNLMEAHPLDKSRSAPVANDSTGPTLLGPFTCARTNDDEFEIRAADGVVSIRVRGEANATMVTKVLNVCYKYGRLRRQ